MSKALFITATGTDVGKTYVTGLLIKKLREAGLNAGYYKAALSGAERQADGTLLPGDAAFVANTASIPGNPADFVSYIYEEAVSPHLAALRSGRPVELAKIKADYATARQSYDYLTVEGSGGIICPIRWDGQKLLLEDIVKELELAVLVVSNAALGSINACVLTTDYLKSKNIPVQGIILNNYDKDDFMQQDNKKMIEALGGVPVIATLAAGAVDISLSATELATYYR